MMKIYWLLFCLPVLMMGCNNTSKDSKMDSTMQLPAFFPNADHIGIIVRDADKEAENLEKRFGAKTVNKQTITFSNAIYKGDTLTYSAYFVFVDLGNIKVEYIQPDLNVLSPYLDILNEKGEYAHHLCFLVKSLDEYIEKFGKDNPDFKIVVEAEAGVGKMVYAEGVVPGILVELATLE